jgi:hypothetical protein
MTAAIFLSGCSGGSSPTGTPASSGTVTVSISDPPSCKNPNGNFQHVYITVRSVQAHIDPNASDGSAGWQELAPQLNSAPMQIEYWHSLVPTVSPQAITNRSAFFWSRTLPQPVTLCPPRTTAQAMVTTASS